MTKRKRQSERVGSKGSSFLSCPCCHKTIPAALINIHLDTDCAPSASEAGLSEPSALPSPAEALPHAAGIGSPLPAAPGPNRAAAAAWWQQGPLQPQPLAFIPSRQRGSPQALTDEQLRQGTPCEIARNALPKELAEQLLRGLLADAPAFTRGQWIMFGKTHPAPRTSCYYSLEEASTDACSEHREYGDVSAVVDRRAATDALRCAADIINATVQRLQKRVEGQLAQRDAGGGWRASYALANFYKDGSESVAAHSDRITPLGKRPTIASLSLGATRTFRLKRAVPEADGGQAAQPGSAAASPGSTAGGARRGSSAAPLGVDRTPEGGSPVAAMQCSGCGISNASEGAGGSSGIGGSGAINAVDVQLEHNTLLVMWPPTQEEFRHEVPRSKRVAPHPISGLARVNLTFRRLDPASAARAPLCRCGHQAMLKAALNRPKQAPGRPKGGHAYYYACDNTKGACGFWQWE